MYNSVTSKIVCKSPKVRGYNLEDLPQNFTEAYSRIITARLAIQKEKDQEELSFILQKIVKLGYYYLAKLNFSKSLEEKKSIAFVAASAFEFSVMHSSKNKYSFTATHLCEICTSALLFLIADSPSDAAEIITHLQFSKDDNAIVLNLKKACRNLALGIVESDFKKNEYKFSDDTEGAVNILYELCLNITIELSKLLKGDTTLETILNSLEEIKTLCIDEFPLNINENEEIIATTFSGPYFLASILENVAFSLNNNSLINIKTNNFLDNNSFWLKEIKRLSTFRPYLWQNHKKIIEQYHFLEYGLSCILCLPTGAGKTTLAQLKTLSVLTKNKQILFLAPTHALVNQVISEWGEIFPNAVVSNSINIDGEYTEMNIEKKPDIFVMTPERCLSLIMINTEAFKEIELIIFDEFHLLHASDINNSHRSTDSMMCLFRLFDTIPNADYVLMSAMVENSNEISAWVESQIHNKCIPIIDDWKPTRQVRSCIVYPQEEIDELYGFLRKDRIRANKENRKNPGIDVKRLLKTKPYGFFSLNQTWNTDNSHDYRLLPLLDEKVNLSVNKYWSLTSNRNVVASSLASNLVKKGIKTIVFTQQINFAESIAKNILPGDNIIIYNDSELTLLNRLVEEVGDIKHVYTHYNNVASCHHGLLLKDERELAESLFKRKDGIKILVATPTIAQGMNLPAEAVIISGDDRYDKGNDSQAQLEAYELLNAAGRAGRAGKHAQGFVLIIPGQIVGFDPKHDSIGNRWFSLKESVFSKNDRCLTIVDPLQLLLDKIQTESNIQDNNNIQYIFQKLPFISNKTIKENIISNYKRSFSAFMAIKENRITEFHKSLDFVSEIGESFLNNSDKDYDDKILSLASELGLHANIIEFIFGKLGDIDNTWTVLHYIKWLFQEKIFTKIIKNRTIEEIIEKLSTKNEDMRINKSLKRVFLMISYWIKGKTLKDIELITGTPPNKLKKCIKARKFVLKWIPDFSYAFGIIARLYRARCEEDSSLKMPIILATLASSVKNGVDSPIKLALMNLYKYEITRTRVNELYLTIESDMNSETEYDTFEEIDKDIRNLLKIKDDYFNN